MGVAQSTAVCVRVLVCLCVYCSFDGAKREPAVCLWEFLIVCLRVWFYDTTQADMKGCLYINM